mmetsp:Transcript_30067/g.59802  ORF Transcript_30067/g.59802 Transcript_30067/m.59802 type:complete len:211 (+) Transcript_30067:3-635(+)
MSDSEEANLTLFQYEKHISIFSCDAWKVFSDGSMDPVLATNLGDIESKWASWNSWENTDVFIRAWAALFREGTWSRYAWTVKVDPDTVWFPDRLHTHLSGLKSNEPLYVRNTGAMMLGPIEVFSAGAMDRLGGNMRRLCMQNKEDFKGEDGWIENCLRTCGVPDKQYKDFLVFNDHPTACNNKFGVALHASKTVPEYIQCFVDAWHAAHD